MTKKLVRLAGPAAAIAASVLPILAQAQFNVPNSPVTTVNNLVGTGGLLCKVFGLLFTILIIVAVIFVIVAAFKYVTAAGDPEKVKSANHQLVYAAIAILVALIAKGLPLIVGSFVGTTGAFGGC